MAQLNFDATQIAPDTGTGDPVPSGWYNVVIDESELKPTKQEGGTRLALRFNILDGQYANRKIFGGMNLRNSNPAAQEIGYKQLSAVCHAVGVLQCQDSQQLHGRPLKIRVKVKPARVERDAQGNVVAEYDASNDITAYKNINEQVDTPASPAAAAPWAPPAAPAPAPAQQWAQPAQQPTQQYAPPAQQPAAAPAPQWQAPAAQQPWQQPAAAAPAPQQPAPQAQAPQAQAAPAPQAGQPATPPWMQAAAAPTGAPPWAQQPQQ